MRKEKLNELNCYIEEFGIKRRGFISDSGKFLQVKRYMFELNNGMVVIREKLVKNGMEGNASIILPVTDRGNALLVVQPRLFTKLGVAVELPAGYVDVGESYEEAARRELFEETGYVPQSMKLLGSFYQDQGCSAAYNKAFLAEGCIKEGEQKLDDDEFIRYFECSFDEVLELVEMGYICDAQSQLAIERSKQYLKN